MTNESIPSVLPFTPPETTVQLASNALELGSEDRRSATDGDVGMYNTGVRFRHSGWKRDRERVYDALRATEQPLNRVFSFLQCGKHAYVLQSQTDPGKYMIGGSTCHDRFCLPCGQERSRRIAMNVIDRLEKEQARFLTLTLRSTNETLTELLTKLTTSFAALRRTKLWQTKVTGGVAFVEIKYNEETDRWHPHFHCLIQGRYLPNKELSALWKKITRDSSIIDIRFVKDNGHVTHYVAKYASKPMDHSVIQDPERLQEAILALKGKRLCMTFGTWQGISLTENVDQDKWINLGLLSEIVKQATEGDPSACQALVALKVLDPAEALQTPSRDPPSQPCPKCTEEQLLFDRHVSFYDLYE